MSLLEVLGMEGRTLVGESTQIERFGKKSIMYANACR